MSAISVCQNHHAVQCGFAKVSKSKYSIILARVHEDNISGEIEDFPAKAKADAIGTGRRFVSCTAKIAQVDLYASPLTCDF